MCDVQNKFTENLLNKIIKKISIQNLTHTHVVQKYPEIQNHSQSCLSTDIISYAYFKHCNKRVDCMEGESVIEKTKCVNL